MNNPITDTHLGIANDKFADVRHKAKIEETERRIGLKKKKKTEPQPELTIDQRIVVNQSYDKSVKGMLEVRIIDIYIQTPARFEACQYFGVVERVVSEKNINLIGHIVKITPKGWLQEYIISNVSSNDIKWIK